MQTSFITRATAATAGTLLLAGIAGAAVAAEPHGDGEVDVNVEIAPLAQDGVLAMTVDGTATTLTEEESSGPRTFTGTLPTVTITDTRDADEIPEGAAWYVLGSSSEFTGDAGQAPIEADHLGWAPHLIDGDDAGLVSEGDAVDTILDEGTAAVGLVGQELFAMAFASDEAAEGDHEWTATADLTLKTEPTVEPGHYSATLTLSLFE